MWSLANSENEVDLERSGLSEFAPVFPSSAECRQMGNFKLKTAGFNRQRSSRLSSPSRHHKEVAV
jgi:hypothetical protein